MSNRYLRNHKYRRSTVNIVYVGESCSTLSEHKICHDKAAGDEQEATNGRSEEVERNAGEIRKGRLKQQVKSFTLPLSG